MTIEALAAVALLAALVIFVLPGRYVGKTVFALNLAPIIGSLYM